MAVNGQLLTDYSFKVRTLKGSSKSKIHIFCPSNSIEDIKVLLNNNNIEVDFNNQNIVTRKENHIYLHFASKLLEPSHKDFLVSRLKYGYHVRPLVEYLDKLFEYTQIELLNSDYFLHQKSFSALRKPRLWKIKRLSDLFFGSILLFLSLPISLLTAIIIKLDSKGPVFYKQNRVGKFNKQFKVIKFRSMKTDAEKNGAQWASKDDCRVTRVGKLIRKLRIDELPQLINVIKGEMSLVGPRPEREVFVQELEKHIPYYRFRHAVKPGVTGWAQVNYPYGASVDDAKWKHRYDIWYIKHQTLFLDIKVMFKTIKVVLFGMGR